jgi:predicted Zn-dependent protease
MVGMLCVSFSISGCAVSRSPVTGKKRAYAYSWEQEVQLGREADPQIVTQYGAYVDEELSQYVTRIGEEILAKSHLRRPDTPEEFQSVEFTFRVLDSPIVNAFALPGGYIYVTRGLLAHMENEAQLAVVLGHEIGHVAARHSSQQALKGQLGQIGLLGGVVLGEVLWGAGQDIMQIGGTAAQLLLMRYSRDNERESDQLGVEYAAMAGYKAEEGAGFFTTLRRISDRAGQQLPGFLSTHPDPGQREVKIREMAGQWASQLEMTKVNQEQLFDEIDGIVVGENPRQGFVRNDVFYHPDLKFQFPTPAGWQVYNSASAVQILEPNQQAVTMFTLESAASPEEAASSLASQQGITVRSSGATTVNGNQAYRLRASGQGQDGSTFEILVYYVAYDGRIYRILGYAPQQVYSTHEPAFLKSMRGFRQLTDTRILAVQPDRLDIVKATKAGPFTALVPSQLPAQFTPDDLAILNQLELTDSVLAGAALKLVE